MCESIFFFSGERRETILHSGTCYILRTTYTYYKYMWSSVDFIHPLYSPSRFNSLLSLNTSGGMVRRETGDNAWWDNLCHLLASENCLWICIHYRTFITDKSYCFRSKCVLLFYVNYISMFECARLVENVYKVLTYLRMWKTV